MSDVTDPCAGLGPAAPDPARMVFNVRDYGAKGDGTTDDTVAFQCAIAAAGRQVTGNASQTADSGMGGVVFVPQGIYCIRSMLMVPQGVGIRGEGMHTSQILFFLRANQDGLVWSSSEAPPNPPFGVGGFLEDIDIKANSYADGDTARNLVVLLHWSDFAFNRVRIIGASQYNLCIQDSLNISAFHLLSWSAQLSNLWVGSLPVTVTTSCRFVGCYFHASVQGPGADVAGLAIAFDGCVFEGSGSAYTEASQTGDAPGLRVRYGTVTLTAPYFEGNFSWDLVAGTEDSASSTQYPVSVAVLNPVIQPNARPKASGTGGFCFERGSVFVQGGTLGGQIQSPLVFGADLDLVQVAVNSDNAPQMATSGTPLTTLPGWVLYRDPETKKVIQAGNVEYRTSS